MTNTRSSALHVDCCGGVLRQAIYQADIANFEIVDDSNYTPDYPMSKSQALNPMPPAVAATPCPMQPSLPLAGVFRMLGGYDQSH